MPTGWPEARLDEAIDTAARHRFDLATEIPLRARLFRVADDEHVLVAVVHHIAADGWSIDPAGGVIWGWRMPAGARGRPRAGRRWRCSMSITRCGSARSWVIWTIADSPIAAQLAYWQQALWPGCPSGLQLPTDRPYPPVADYRGASVAVDWPAELQQRVARVAREHNATSFMVVQAALGGAAGQAQRQLRCGGGVPDRRAPRPRAR